MAQGSQLWASAVVGRPRVASTAAAARPIRTAQRTVRLFITVSFPYAAFRVSSSRKPRDEYRLRYGANAAQIGHACYDGNASVAATANPGVIKAVDASWVLDGRLRAVITRGHDDPRDDRLLLPLWYCDYRRLINSWRALSIHFPQADG